MSLLVYYFWRGAAARKEKSSAGFYFKHIQVFLRLNYLYFKRHKIFYEPITELILFMKSSFIHEQLTNYLKIMGYMMTTWTKEFLLNHLTLQDLTQDMQMCCC